MEPKAEFIVIEGIDGSGKDTLAKNLADYMIARHKRVMITREPTQRFEKVLLSYELDRHSQLFLFAADRIEHIKNDINPALLEGTNVISIRFSPSTFAYQTEGEESYSYQLARTIIQDVETYLIKQPIIICLDIPVKIALERLASRENTHRAFETKERLEMASTIYKNLRVWYPYYYCLELSGTETPEEVLHKTIAVIKKHGANI